MDEDARGRVAVCDGDAEGVRAARLTQVLDLHHEPHAGRAVHGRLAPEGRPVSDHSEGIDRGRLDVLARAAVDEGQVSVRGRIAGRELGAEAEARAPARRRPAEDGELRELANDLPAARGLPRRVVGEAAEPVAARRGTSREHEGHEREESTHQGDTFVAVSVCEFQ